MAELPPPPVPANASLQHFPNMPLEVSRLRDSGIANEADTEVFRCGVMLWCAGWHQTPAGSLPADDASLTRLAGLGRDLKRWRKLRAGALRGYRLFADGRLYHPVASQKVIEAWNSTCQTSWYRACERQRKDNKARKDAGLAALPMPDKPPVVPLEWPAEERPPSAGSPPENALKEGKERTYLLGPPNGGPSEEQSTSSPIAARGGHEGPTHDAVRSIVERAANVVRMPA